MSRPLISVSLTDSPLFLSFDELFKGLSDTGVEAVELVVGLKSRWNLPALQKTAKTYGLIIQSVHQTIWSGLEIYFDEGFLTAAVEADIHHVTFHPLMRTPLDSEKMRCYLTRVSEMKKKYDLTVMLENMAQYHGRVWADILLPSGEGTYDPVQIAKTAASFGLKMTYDVSHQWEKQPQKTAWFKEIYPTIGNIHLSSFRQGKDHLPLDMGEFDSEGFLQYLKGNDYKGLLTFEIFYPKHISMKKYDYDAIRRSVEIVRATYK